MNRWVIPVALLVGAVCTLAATRGGFVDIEVYRYGGRTVLAGGDLYAAREGLPFTYPPFAAMLFTATLPLPFPVLVGIWTVASVLCLGYLVQAFAPRLDRHRGPALAGLTVLALAFEPVWSNLAFAQVNLFLVAGICLDLLRSERRSAGWLVGVTAGIKLTPLIFVVFLVLVGRKHAALNAVAAFFATVLVGLVVLPTDTAAYWTGVLWDPNRVGGVAYAGNQSVLGVLTRLLGGQPPTWLWLVVAAPVALGVLLLAARRHRTDPDLAVCLAGVAMLLASPISWDHHWVWAVPIALWLLRGRPVAAALWTIVFVSAGIWWPPETGDRELGWGPGWQLVGNSFVLAGVALVVAVGAQSRAGRTRPRTSPSSIRPPSVPGAV